MAEIDLEHAKDWYEIQKENLGDEFLVAISETLLHIKKDPNHFSQTKKNTFKAVVKRFPFSIYFTIINEQIIVFAVFHHSRNPIVWKNRLK